MTRGYRSEGAALTITRARGVLFELFNAFTSILANDFQWLSALYIPMDTEVGLPAELPPAVTGTQLLTDMSPQDKITSFTFAGKSTAGSKCRISVYGCNYFSDAPGPNIYKDFLLLATESAVVDNAVTKLNDASVAAIDDGVAIWYPRATIKVNDHWLKEVRTGGIT